MLWSRYAKRLLGLDDVAIATTGAIAACSAMLFGAGGYVWASKAGQGTAAIACLATALSSAFGIAAFWLSVRLRSKAVAAIRHALLAIADGETDPQAISVSETFGAEARVWNCLLEELLTLRQQRCVRLAISHEATSTSRDEGLRSAIDLLWHGIIITDAGLSITYANGASAMFLGALRDKLPGSSLSNLITDPSARETLIGMIATDAVRSSRVVIETPLLVDREDATFRLAGRRCSGGEAFIFIIEDVSQQRMADRARNAFVAQATHELRTPLTNIRLGVETLIDTPAMEAAQQAELLNVISGEARRLERLVGDMLSVSEIEAGTMRITRDDLRIEEMMRQIESEFKHPASHKQINLTFSLAPKLPVLHADRDKIVLAVSNLVGNALKYTPTGGTVNVMAHVKGDALLIEVADTGLGIAAHEQDLIFDRFYRAKDDRIASITGTGLGLALARQVIRLHNGDITVTSELNKGSTFTLCLPMSAPVSLAA